MDISTYFANCTDTNNKNYLMLKSKYVQQLTFGRSNQTLVSSILNCMYKDITKAVNKCTENDAKTSSLRWNKVSIKHEEVRNWVNYVIHTIAIDCYGIDDIITSIQENPRLLDTLELIPSLVNCIYGTQPYSFGDVDEPKTKESGRFRYIPFGVSRFIKVLKEIPGFVKGKKFVDIGSGVGDKALVASLLMPNTECHGIEYSEFTHKVACTLVPRITSVKFTNIDALKYQNFGDFDRIYTYCPARDDRFLRKLYRHVLKQLKPGTIWIEVLSPIELISQVKRLKIQHKTINIGRETAIQII